MSSKAECVIAVVKYRTGWIRVNTRHRWYIKRNEDMAEVAAAFFSRRYHSANTCRANRHTSGAPVDADISVNSHMATPMQIHPHTGQSSHLCPLKRAAHTWLQSRWWNPHYPDSGRTGRVDSDVNLQTFIKVCFVRVCWWTDGQHPPLLILKLS